MDERRLEQFVPEPDLEALLADSPPPEDILREVTPWRRAMNRVLAGLALTSLTLQFFCLDYILPAVGYLQLLLGLRVLRRENGFFRLWWGANLLRSGWFYLCLLLRAVPGHWALDALPLFRGINGVSLGLQFVQLFCLWQGLRGIQRRAGRTPQAGGGALIVWHAIIVALALAGYSGWLLGAPVLIAYIFILRGLYRLSGELDEAGYAVQAAPVRVSDRVLTWGITAGLAVGLAVCFLFLNRFPMDWQPADPAEQAQAAELRAELLELGFPENVLNDLALEDLLACGEPLRVVTDVFEYPRDDYRNAPDEVTMRVTEVAVELAGERERWRIFHHFTLLEPPRPGTYAIQLWPTYGRPNMWWAKSSEITGRVLYDRDGAVWWSPYYSLGNQTYTSNSIFWGEQTSTDFFASFSLSRQGEKHRGYVTYEAAETRDGCIIDSWFNFIQPTGQLRYPRLSAQEWRMAGYINWDTAPYLCIQSALQFYPPTVDEDGVF